MFPYGNNKQPSRKSQGKGPDGKVLFRATHYTADFSYRKVPDGELTVEDVKSDYTRKEKETILRRKMMYFVHHIYVEEVVM